MIVVSSLYFFRAPVGRPAVVLENDGNNGLKHFN